MAHTLQAYDVVPLTGKRAFRYTLAFRDLVDDVQIKRRWFDDIEDDDGVDDAADGEGFVVMSFVGDLADFVSLSINRAKQGPEARAFLKQMLKLGPEEMREKEFYVFPWNGNAKFDLGVTVDTDAAACLERFESHRRDDRDTEWSKDDTPLQVDVDVDFFGRWEHDAAVLTSRDTLKLTLGPGVPMEVFDGYAAIDFGNTNTTIARCRINEESFELVQADQRSKIAERGKPIRTALLVTDYKPAGPDDFSVYDCKIGRRALEEDAGWVVLGAKRLLSDRRKGAASSCTMMLDGVVHRIPMEDPAELFLAEVAKGFFYHEQAIPEPLVVTCPTTFTKSEVERLRRTVARGLHRALRQTRQSWTRGLIERRVPLVVDEASAAAFYFAYVDFIAGPGRLPAFRYLYPAGMNMLLYDCGGGTTDMSLVRLESPDEGHLRVRVLGRTGHRSFGGDFITLQIYRLIKMKLAVHKGLGDEAPKPAELAVFLSAFEDRIERIVQTTYDVRQMQNDDDRSRSRRAMAIWQVAEQMKVLLSRLGCQSVEPSDIVDQRVLEELKRATGFEYRRHSEQLKVHRREVDALVDPEIDRTIGYTNDLIGGALVDDAIREGSAETSALEIPEVHWVYVVGNAARYPRIMEKLLDPQAGLNIRFLGDRVANVKPEDLKNSVAKGAIVAMRLQRMAMGMAVSWDQDLVSTLSFDVVHESLGRADDHVLFANGDKYSADMLAVIQILADPGTGRAVAREVVLSRRWPGEARSEKFLVFRFPEAIVGAYVVAYDEELESFVAYPDRRDGKDDRVVAEPFEAAPYVAPPQSGLI